MNVLYCQSCGYELAYVSPTTNLPHCPTCQSFWWASWPKSAGAGNIPPFGAGFVPTAQPRFRASDEYLLKVWMARLDPLTPEQVADYRAAILRSRA